MQRAPDAKANQGSWWIHGSSNRIAVREGATMQPSTRAIPWAHPSSIDSNGTAVNPETGDGPGRKGAMSALTLNDCPDCGLVETRTGGHPRCPDCGRRFGCEEPPERGDYDYDEAP